MSLRTKPSGFEVIKRMGLKSIKPITRDSIPMGRGHKKSDLLELQVMKDLDCLLKLVGRDEISPYEVLGEIDVNQPDIQMAMKKRKTFKQTFRLLLKKRIADHALEGKIDVVERNHGERFFLVGREAA